MKIKFYDITYVSLIFLTIYLYFSYYPINVDSRWILYASNEILNGKTLYTDIVEVNPPLIFIYATLPILLSNIFNTDYINMFVIFCSILVVISLCLSYLILNKLENINETRLRFYLYSILFLLTINVAYEFGEREHLLIIFLFPYLIYSMYRNKIKIGNIHLVSITIFAILGLNFKPHFFLVILMLEIFYMFYFKNIFYFFRLDFILIILSGFFYLTIIYFLFPEFYSFGLPLAVKTYLGLFNKPLVNILVNINILLSVLIFLYLFIFSIKRFNFSNIVLIIIILSFLIIYLLQQKGWFYHLIPFYTFTLFFLIHNILTNIKKENIIYASFFIPFIVFSILINLEKDTHYKSLENILFELPKESKIQILSTDIAEGQVLLKHNQVWSSRFGTLGILPYVVKSNDLKVKQYLLRSIYEDLTKYKPDFIIYSNLFDYNKYLTSNDYRIKNIISENYIISVKNNYNILTKIKDF